MRYGFQCSQCQDWHNIAWSRINQQFKCPNTNVALPPPRPGQQSAAYVNDVDWPPEMEEAVLELRGVDCCFPGCNRHYETLDHIRPLAYGGRTSAQNLLPVCESHARSKTDPEWVKVLARLLEPTT